MNNNKTETWQQYHGVGCWQYCHIWQKNKNNVAGYVALSAESGGLGQIFVNKTFRWDSATVDGRIDNDIDI